MMRYPEIAKWFREKYFEWETESGRPRSVSDFSELLGISQPTGSAYINGTRKPNLENALKIAEKLNDFSVLKILNYSHPNASEVPFDSLPSELRERLRAALGEIEETLKTRAIQPDSPEGSAISESVLKKFGFTVSSIEKG